MSRRHRPSGLLALCALMLILAAPAGAQTGGSLISFGFPPGERLLSYKAIPVHISGQLAVSFSGSPAAGCASEGVCGYSGTIVWRPAAGDELDLLKLRRHGKIDYQAELFGSGNLAQTETRVTRGSGPTAAVCADSQSSSDTSPMATAHGGLVQIRLLSARGSLLATRCAGPRDGDVATGPGAEVKLAALVSGHVQADLRGVSLFRAHGFAGTVRSTVVMTFGQPRSPGSVSIPKSVHRTRLRTVTEQLQLVRATGSEQANVTGSADPAICLQLDACGLSGTISWTPVPTAVDAFVTVTEPATRSYRELVAVLHGKPGAIKHPSVYGEISWTDHGSLQARITQAGATCTDAEPLQGAEIALLAGNSNTAIGYSPSGALRTRCPGPEFSEPMASGRFPLGLLSKPTFRLALTPAASFTDDGYAVQVHGGLALTLRRGRVQQSVQTVP